MINLRSILSLLAMGSVVIDNPVPKRFVGKALSCVALVVITCLLSIALILAGFFCFYTYMISIGYTSLEASLMIAGGIGTMTAIAAIFMARSVKALMKSINSDFKRSVPLPSHIANQTGNVIEAFVEGLMNRKQRQ